MRARFRVLAVAAATGVALSTGAALAVTAQDTEPVSTTAPSGAPSPMGLVEDYSYPGADEIYEQQGVRLIEGDGNILLAECGSAENLVEVYSRELPQQNVCFDIQGPSGYLRMEIPEVYGITGDDHTIEAVITVDNTTKVIDVNETGWTPVGEGNGNGPATLLELRASS